MIEFILPRTFLTVSTTTGIVIVWYCWRWIRWQEKRAANTLTPPDKKTDRNEC